MKLATLSLIAAGIALIANARSDDYSTLAAQGYRWVTVNGPYACTTERDVHRLVTHRTDAAELRGGAEHSVLLPHTRNHRAGD
jgi:hypothetical protein